MAKNEITALCAQALSLTLAVLSVDVRMRKML